MTAATSHRFGIRASSLFLFTALAIPFSPRLESAFDALRLRVQRDVLARECLALATALQQDARDGLLTARVPRAPELADQWLVQDNGELISAHGRFRVIRLDPKGSFVVHAASFAKRDASVTIFVRPGRTENPRYSRWY